MASTYVLFWGHRSRTEITAGSGGSQASHRQVQQAAALLSGGDDVTASDVTDAGGRG